LLDGELCFEANLKDTSDAGRFTELRTSQDANTQHQRRDSSGTGNFNSGALPLGHLPTIRVSFLDESVPIAALSHSSPITLARWVASLALRLAAKAQANNARESADARFAQTLAALSRLVDSQPGGGTENGEWMPTLADRAHDTLQVMSHAAHTAAPHIAALGAAAVAAAAAAQGEVSDGREAAQTVQKVAQRTMAVAEQFLKMAEGAPLHVAGAAARLESLDSLVGTVTGVLGAIQAHSDTARVTQNLQSGIGALATQLQQTAPGVTSTRTAPSASRTSPGASRSAPRPGGPVAANWPEVEDVVTAVTGFASVGSMLLKRAQAAAAAAAAQRQREGGGR